ncbi:tyrosine-type recombinase/integrase [Devosia sp. LjRoot16]|uniref:tyrosine-type recombinase/integrase n=1 Tax=Devosia sp. LjRoot16 TaxID=3342271 RepID=UPI003ED0C768
MRTRLPPNTHREKNRHGTVVFYYRVGKGSRIRLPDFGTTEFQPAYEAACRGEPLPQAHGRAEATVGTLRWLVIEYKKSLHFRELDAVTQRRRDTVFRGMVEKSGDRLIKRITEQTIIDAREKRSTGKGHAANGFLKAVRPMFAYARTRGWIEVDPTRNVDRVKTPKGGFRPWTIDELRQFEARHPLGTMANLAVRLLLFTGLRRSDVVKLGRQHIRKGVVHFRPGKTADSSGVTVTFTALPPMLEAIEATKTGDLTFLVSSTGQPFKTGNSFGNWFSDRCDEAEVPGSAHGLRKLGATLAAEAGATTRELMAMWGWTTMKQPELYTRSADTEVLGTSASSKLMEGYSMVQTENNIPRTLDAGAGIKKKAE